MKFYFSARRTITGLILIAICLGMSQWQWRRYLEKQEYIAELDARLLKPVTPLSELLQNVPTSWDKLIHRRVSVQGTFDFSHEFVLRNRKYQDQPGYFVITPLTLRDSDERVLVNRGFIPYDRATPEERVKFQHSTEASITGLVKHSMEGWSIFGMPLGPQDKTPSGPNARIDSWLRIEIPKLQLQFPYPLLPVYLEIIDGLDPERDAYKFLQTKSGKDDMLSLATRDLDVKPPVALPDTHYPIPIFDTIVPPGRHYGYVWQWLFIAFLIGLTTVMLQLRPPRLA